MYKEPKSYKGFEKIWHEIQMTGKMYFYTFASLLIFHLLIPFIYLFIFDFEVFKLIFKAFFSFNPELWSKAVAIFFKKVLLIFLLVTPIWFLFPVLLNRYKKKARLIMQDEYLRGARFISDIELRKIILKDIREGRRL